MNAKKSRNFEVMKNTFAEKCNRCDNKFMQTVFASLRHKAEGKNDELSFVLMAKNYEVEDSVPFFFITFLFHSTKD